MWLPTKPKSRNQLHTGISGELSFGGGNTRLTDSGHLEFEIEVPAELTDSQKLASGNMGSDEEEWETVGEEGGSQGPSPETSFSTGRNWRDRMSNRSGKYLAPLCRSRWHCTSSIMRYRYVAASSCTPDCAFCNMHETATL